MPFCILLLSLSEGNEQRSLHKSATEKKSTAGNGTEEIATVWTYLPND